MTEDDIIMIPVSEFETVEGELIPAHIRTYVQYPYAGSYKNVMLCVTLADAQHAKEYLWRQILRECRRLGIDPKDLIPYGG